jgi:two-component system chemotaxis response regulator CheB
VVRGWAAKAPPRQHEAHRDSRGDATARPRGTVRVVAIAASTGGPGVLQQILSELPRRFAVPILVVQHIATGFASGLADWLATTSALRVTVAQSGDRALPRTVYLAPDDHHLGIGADGRLVVAGSPAVAGFRPSASFLFEAAARAYGTAAVGVILTGMGQDGVEGLKAVKAAGGVVLAQDEATSVVFGMPREAIRVGVVDDVLTPTAIAARLGALVGEE